MPLTWYEKFHEDLTAAADLKELDRLGGQLRRARGQLSEAEWSSLADLGKRRKQEMLDCPPQPLGAANAALLSAEVRTATRGYQEAARASRALEARYKKQFEAAFRRIGQLEEDVLKLKGTK